MSATLVPEPISFTVAILSHRRPHLLGRVLGAVAQLDYPNFEIVVVGDQPLLRDYMLPIEIEDQVRYVFFDGANIGRSRNLAVAASGGEIVAFCDDDAVPEPDWLTQLAKAFRFPDVGGVGGFVRADDGVTLEWSGGVFDRSSTERSIRIPDNLRVYDAESQVYGNEFIGTMGANSAFRREAVLSVGGFDESIRYYLDETDLMLRLAEAGWDAALVRDAEVHHKREPNAARGRLRAPINLHEIAASRAYFCRRHLPEDEVSTSLKAFGDGKMSELDPHIRLGIVRAKDRATLLSQIEAGIADGLARELSLPDIEQFRAPPFAPFKRDGRPLRVALAAGWGLRSLLETKDLARKLGAAGLNVTCFLYRWGFARRTIDYQDDVWWHRGGTWRPYQHAKGRRRIARSARAWADCVQFQGHRGYDIYLTPAPFEAATLVTLPRISKPYFAAMMPQSDVTLADALKAIEHAVSGDKVHENSKEVRYHPGTGLKNQPGRAVSG